MMTSNEYSDNLSLGNELPYENQQISAFPSSLEIKCNTLSSANCTILDKNNNDASFKKTYMNDQDEIQPIEVQDISSAGFSEN